MASSCVVPVCEIIRVYEHPNATLLGLVEVLGYQMVSGLVEDPDGDIVRVFEKDQRDDHGRRIPVTTTASLHIGEVEEVRYSHRYKVGDKVVYFPAYTIITDEWAEKFDVKHLLKGENRVGKIRLRGEPSFGLLAAIPDGEDWEIGFNAAEYFGAVKYIPPPRDSAAEEHEYEEDVDPFFDGYSDIENGKIFIDVFDEGETVIATEKIHGTNSRVGIINDCRVAGSMSVRKALPEGQKLEENRYWFPWSIQEVNNLLEFEFKGNKAIIMYGEIFGSTIQSLHYGFGKNRGVGYRAFDIKIDGNYLKHADFEALCNKYGVEMVPVLYRGPYSMAKMKEISDGKTTLLDQPGKKDIREGVVVKPLTERRHPSIGRVVLKYIGDSYALTDHTDFTDV